MTVTLRDVAEKAGVSVGTVSRIVNGKDSTNSNIRISDITRQKVTDIVEKYNYYPNQNARSLRTQKTYMLGVCSSYLADPYVSKVLSSINIAAHSFGYRLMLSVLEQESEPVDAFHKMFNKSSVDGVIVMEYDSKLNNSALKKLHDEGIKMVLFNREVNDSSIPSVLIDNVKGGFFAAEHLLSLGHRRIVFLGVKDSQDSTDRLNGMKMAYKKFGLEIDNELIIQDIYVPNPFDLSKQGYDSMTKYLDTHDTPTAVFAFDDVFAFAAIIALRDKGLSVPGDVAVVGFDDMDNVAAYYNPSLTSVRQPSHDIGKCAVELLINLIENDDDKIITPRSIIEPELIIRESSGGSLI